MTLNFKDAETDRLARELASETGESLTVAARVAIEERLARVRRRSQVSDVADELRAIAVRARARPVGDDPSPEEVVGYDEHRLPR